MSIIVYSGTTAKKDDMMRYDDDGDDDNNNNDNDDNDNNNNNKNNNDNDNDNYDNDEPIERHTAILDSFEKLLFPRQCVVYVNLILQTRVVIHV